jgi:hypothetical protein
MFLTSTGDSVRGDRYGVWLSLAGYGLGDTLRIQLVSCLSSWPEYIEEHCNYDIFVDSLSYGNKAILKISQLNGIFKVENFYMLTT